LLNPDNFPAPQDVPRNVVSNSVSFDNRVQGFYANHHPGGIDWLNNTAFDNSRGFDLINEVDPGNWPAGHFLRNNISYANSSNRANANQTLIDDQSNTWNGGFAATAADFLSLVSQAVDGPRLADGSLPELNFLKLAAGSGLIDAGVDIGKPFKGDAPDLGAFESAHVAGLLPGDVNGDLSVDLDDFQIIVANLNDTVPGRKFGDLTRDGMVDFADFRQWKANFTPSLTAQRRVPEPGGVDAGLGELGDHCRNPSMALATMQAIHCRATFGTFARRSSLGTRLAAMLLATCFTTSSLGLEEYVSILDAGAVAGGEKVNTRAIQKTIDQVAANGGGWCLSRLACSKPERCTSTRGWSFIHSQCHRTQLQGGRGCAGGALEATARYSAAV